MTALTAALTDAQTAFLRDNPFVRVVTTLRRDGSPHATIVWVDVDEQGAVSFNTAHGRAKPRNLARDPRLSLTVVDPGDAYRWVALTGTGRLVDEDAEAQIDRLARKYLGREAYPWRAADERRVSVRIDVEKVDAFGFDD